MNVTFEGQVDTANSQVVQNISINYSDSVKFPFSFKQMGNTVGIQTDYVGSKYIAVDKEELQSLDDIATSEDGLTVNEDSFEKLQEFVNVQLTQEDLQHLQDTYFNIMNEQLQDSSFSKIEEANSKGYRLTLTGEELKNLIIKLLETLKNDQVTLDKINEYLKIYKNSSKITTSDIDNFIKDINNNLEINDKNIEITVYQEKQKILKLTVKINNEATIQIEKNLTGNSQQYSILLEINQEDVATMKINLSANYSGVQSLQSIAENYELNIEYEGQTQESSSSENSMVYRYNFINNIDFSDSINIENFSTDNSMLLNDYEEEQITSFMQAVEERLEETNKKQMEELGLEENENPLQYVIPQFGIYTSALDASNISEEELTTFNSKFENYESTNLQGVTVKGLLSTIQLNNESQEEDIKKIKEIHFDGQEYEVTDQNITLIKSSVETETAYRVEFERDEDTGLIYRAVINKK